MTDWTACLIVIPARLQATRLPRKPLADLAGKPLIVRVYERLAPLLARGAEIVVATDAAEVMEACAAHGVPAVMTSAAHQSGTDRCAEVAKSRPQARPYVMNVQGDEPFVHLDDLTSLLGAIQGGTHAMATLVHRNENEADYLNPNCVKAIRSDAGQALYFSRSPLPYFRAPARFSFFWQHIGVYCFHRDGLARFCSLSPHPLEQSEGLEQLRALGHGISIMTAEARHASIGIDTPQDLEAARARFA